MLCEDYHPAYYMTLTTDNCGGPNPLVSLADRYRSISRNGALFQTTGSSSSHLIEDLLSHIKKETANSDQSQQSHSSLRCQAEPLTKHRKCLNERFSEFSISQPPPPSKYLPHWRPHQRNPRRQKSSCSKDQLHNKNFEDWVKKHHPEILRTLKSSAVVDVELSHELAEKWLHDFNLNEVLNVDSICEAENVVDRWIREFQLGQTQQTSLTFGEKVSIERDKEKDYQYMTVGDAHTGESFIDSGIEKIQDGDLLSAIAIFEKIVKDDRSCGEAWYYLGLCHQQAENEEHAISAFKNVSEGDLVYPSALLGLSASYLNESKPNSATLCLADWIRLQHPDSLLPGSERNATRLREVLTTIPRTPHNDVEIQTGLGILSCILDEHHIAADHFRAAVDISPQDFMLWNRLGATLANSDQSGASVEAYRRALRLSPGYIRARYNLGIACLNLRAYREGIEHFLQCLKQQDSTAVWRALRMALSLGQHYEDLIHVDNLALAPLLSKFNML